MSIYTADVETEAFSNGRFVKFIVGCVYDGKGGYKFFYNAFEMWLYMSKLGKKIYFHNGGKFDFHQFRDFFTEQDLLIVVNRIVAINCGNSKLIDSYAILPIPLREYKKDDFDYSKLEIEKVKNDKNIMDELKQYLKGDCLYLYDLVSQFIKTKTNALTLASSSVKVAKQMGYKIKKNKSGDFDKTFRPHYRGGRVQPFKKGYFEKVYCYDIASSYPSAYSRDHPYGRKYLKIKTSILPDDLGMCLLCFKSIKTDFESLPFVINGKLEFLKEANNFFLYGYEFEAIKSTGILKSYLLDYYYMFINSINLSNYANYFFKQKRESKKGSANYIIAKLYLNSIYGAFGMNPENYRKYKLIKKSNIKKLGEVEKHLYNLRNFSKSLFLVDRGLLPEEKLYLNVATAGSITAYARGSLLKHLVKNKKELIYCDTDSVFLTKKITLNNGGALGSLVYEGCYKGHILDRKLYHLTSLEDSNIKKTASKGAKLTSEQWQELIKKGGVSVPFNAPVLSWKTTKVYAISKNIGEKKEKQKRDVKIVFDFNT